MVGTQCADHLGNTFPSVRAMCRAWRINPATFKNRMQIGWDLEKALATKTPGPTSITGPDGHTYKSIRSMCTANGMSSATVCRHIAAETDMQSAVVTALERTGTRAASKACADHIGQTHDNETRMCAAWGVRLTTFRRRIRTGWSVQRALTVPPNAEDTVYDPVGREFKSATEMCRSWHVPYVRYRYYARMKKTAGDAVAACCRISWPGKTAGPYEILHQIQFPWFLCSDDANQGLLLHADTLKDLMQE